MGHATEKKNYIKRYMRNHRISTQLNIYQKRKLIYNEVNKRRDLAFKNAKDKFDLKEASIPNANFAVVVDIENDFSPTLSIRDIIYKWLSDRYIDNYKIINYVDSQLKKKDYLTDNELKVSENIFDQVKKIRNIYDYNSVYDHYYTLFDQLYHDDSHYKCRYCGKYILNLKDHYKRCISAQNAFYSNKGRFINEYILTFYNPVKLRENEQMDAIYYFCNYDYHTFLSNIGVYLISHKAAINRIEKLITKKKAESAKKIPKEPFNAKKFVEEFTKEFDEYAKTTGLYNNETTVDEEHQTNKNIHFETTRIESTTADILVPSSPHPKFTDDATINLAEKYGKPYESTKEDREFLRTHIGKPKKKKIIKFIAHN